MPQRDLVAELRAARVAAPSDLRDRVRAIAASTPQPARRLTWRRPVAFAVPVAAALAAGVVVGGRSHHEAAAPTTPKIAMSAPAATGRAADTSTLTLRVADAPAAVARVTRIAVSLGGTATAARGQVTVRLPAAHMATGLARIAALDRPGGRATVRVRVLSRP